MTTAQCCTYVFLPDRPLTGDEVNWLHLHNLTVDVSRNVRLDVACGALVDGACALFGEPERPQMCLNYPEHPELDDGCSYQFERIGGVSSLAR